MMMNMRCVALMGMIFLAGCSVFSPVKTESINTYVINKVPHVPVKRANSQTILVIEPEAAPLYNTTDMAYSTYRYQIAYFVKNRWVETPAKMLQSVMMQTLANSHHYRAVVAPQFPGHYDLILNTQLLKLQQDFTHNPSLVTLSMRAQLVSVATNRVIATKEFSIVKVAPQNSPYGFVVAANAAAAEMLQRLTVFLQKR